MPAARASADELLARFTDAQALLAQVSRDVGPALDLSSTLANVIMAMRRLVDFRGGSVCLVERDRVSIAAADPPVSDDVMAASLPVGEGLAGRIASTGEVIYSPDLDIDDRVDPALRRMGSNAGMTSYLGVPLICLGEVIGLLQVDSPTVDAFDEVDRILLEGLASQMASAIASAHQFDEHMRLEGLKNGFIQMVSHELRTPLAIGTGMLGVVRSHLDDMPPEEIVDLLSRSASAFDRLTKLIEELLMMTRLMGNAVKVNLVPTPLGPLLERVRDGSPDSSLVTIAAAEPTTVHTDGNLLERVLDELVENAVLYAGGCTIAVEGHTITVRDHGPGIPADVASVDFETFNRGDNNETTIAGLGLGLTMSRALLGELGGSLTLSTPDDGGTLASVMLPLTDP